MNKRYVIVLLFCCVVTTVLVACGGERAAGPVDEELGNSVHMNNTDFLVPSITIAKGESLTLIADTSIPHVVANGTWEPGMPKPEKEAGAPDINNIEIKGNSSGTIGPFNTAGTFQLYCPLHPGMNLTVTVE